MCVLCACCFRETKAFCQSVFMIVFVFVHDSVHEYHTTFIQRRDVQCVFVRNSIRQLSYREMCVLPTVHCNSRAAPTQTNDASLGPTEPTSLGRGHENDVSLPVSQSPTSCPSSQLRFAKMTSGSVSVASCSDRRKKSLLANCACKNNQWWTYLNEKVVKTVANDCFHLRNKFAVTILRFLHLAPFSLFLSRSWSLLVSRWKSQSGPLSEWVSGPQRREADKDSKIGWL